MGNAERLELDVNTAISELKKEFSADFHSVPHQITEMSNGSKYHSIDLDPKTPHSSKYAHQNKRDSFLKTWPSTSDMKNRITSCISNKITSSSPFEDEGMLESKISSIKSEKEEHHTEKTNIYRNMGSRISDTEECNNISNFNCDECNSAFTTKSNLTRHKKNHSNIRDWTCDECDYSSYRRDKLSSHKESKHGSNEFVDLVLF